MLEGDEDDKNDRWDEYFHSGDIISVMLKRVISVNIQGQNHLDKIAAFLEREDADIVCLMEVYNVDVKALSGTKYPYTQYAPNNVVSEDRESKITMGVAILSKKPMAVKSIFYSREFNQDKLEMVGEGTHAPVVLMVQLGELQIGTTHFSWTREGSIDERQRRHVGELVVYLSTQGEFVLCGDFNIPRPNEMYQILRQKLIDNIPSDIDNSIDPMLHRANWEEPGKLKFMVDYVWSTPKYIVKNVRMVSGVSDHLGILYDVEYN